MNLKKIAILVAVLGLSGLVLGACGSKKSTNNKDVIEGSVSDLTKDAVDVKSKVVDGKEVKEYTMSDGNVIQIPADEEGGDDSAKDDSSSEN